MSLLDYDPQRLLTDQRTHEKKIHDAVDQIVYDFFDKLVARNLLRLPEAARQFSGGTVTGRWSSELKGRPPIQMPRDEYVIPRDRYRKD